MADKTIETEIRNMTAEDLQIAMAVLVKVEEDLRENALQNDSSVPADTTAVLLSAQQILKTFGCFSLISRCRGRKCGGSVMSAAMPTFSEMRFKAIRERVSITATVLMANDDVRTITFGPRGGWRPS